MILNSVACCRETFTGTVKDVALGTYRGTSLIRNNPSLESYLRLMPRALWWSSGGRLVLMSEVPL